MQTTTSYLGFRLPHPFMAGASPLGSDVDSVKKLEDAGCAAVVLPSLFEEQITLSHQRRIHHMDPLSQEFAAALADFPAPAEYSFSPDAYAEHVRRLKAAVRIPVIASLNGTAPESWLRFAAIVEQAGADALELNLYEVVTDLRVPGAAIEHRSTQIVREVKRLLKIPLAVKLMPYFTSFGNMATRLDGERVDALVLFNRFYESDIDIRTMRVATHVELSTSAELLLRLHWLAILYGRVRPALAVTGGIASPDDAIKAILAGADAVQLVSALLRHGPTCIERMREGLERWMEWHKFERLEDARGRMSLERAPDASAFERGTYIRTLQSWGR